MSEGLQTNFSNLASLIKATDREYSMGPLLTEAIKNKTRIENLTLIDEHDRKIRHHRDNSAAYMLHRMTSLTTEYLDPKFKMKMSKFAKEKVMERFKAETDSDSVFGDQSEIISSWRKKYLKVTKNSLVENELKKYKKLYKAR